TSSRVSRKTGRGKNRAITFKEGWSPEQIAGRLGFEDRPVRVSHETIYAYVYGPDGRSEDLADIFPAGARNGSPATRDGPAALFFRRIARSMNGLTT
ncbi:MAG: hypothetical protein WEB56_07195, partial [Roseovarius sp.]